MSDGGASGASAILGVLVGALLVIFLGAALLMNSGKLGGNSAPSFTIKMPSAAR